MLGDVDTIWFQFAGNGKHDKCVYVCCAYEAETDSVCRDWKPKDERIKRRDEWWEDLWGGGLGRWDGGASVRGAGARHKLTANTAQVVHGSVKGELHSFAEGRGVTLHQLNSVERLVDSKGSHLGSRKPLPGERKYGFWKCSSIIYQSNLFIF